MTRVTHEQAREAAEAIKLYEHGYTGSTPHYASDARILAAQFDRGIVATAFRVGDVVLTLPRPARHCHYYAPYNAECRAEGWDFPWAGWSADVLRGAEQGFITHDGAFVGRVEAASIALECGQIERLNWPPNLYSEDLW